MRNIALASLDLHLVYLTASSERNQAPSCNVRVSPMRDTQLRVVLRLQSQSMASPSQQRLSLANNPVLASIHVDGHYAGDWRLGGDESCDGTCGRNLLVEKGNANGGAAEGLEDGERGEGVFRLATEGDEGAATGVEGLRGREGDGEEGEGRADDLEARIWGRQSVNCGSAAAHAVPGGAVGSPAPSTLVCGSSAGSDDELVAEMLMHRAAIRVGRAVADRVRRARALQGEAAGRSMAVPVN